MKILLFGMVLGAASCAALAQNLACNPTSPRADPGTGFVASGRAEQIVGRAGSAGAGWEWAVDNVKGNLDWRSGVTLQWTVVYSASGAAMLEVRNQGALVLSLSKASGMSAGNALQLQLSTNSSIGPGTTIAASAGTINGQPVSGALSLTGSNQDSTQSLYFYHPAMKQGVTATGDVTLTFASLPAGSRVDFQLRSGNVPCNNQAPTVSVSAPAPESLHQAGRPIILSANALDSDGAVAQVEFLANGKVIGADTIAPFSFDWNAAAAGGHVITARATDSAGDRTTSDPLSITVNAQPAVSITSPAPGTVLQVPGSVTLDASAADSDGPVSKVDFYQGGVLIGTDTQSPYSLPLANLPAGSYSFTAVATDDRGGVMTSGTVAVVVNAPPTASLTSPTHNAVFTAPANVPITGQVADTDGTITVVEFYYGNTLITTLSTAPYSFTWTGVPQGTYSLTAKAMDNSGGTVTSSSVDITVNSGEAKLYFIHVDHLNTPRLIADDQQQTVWRWDQQEPFGDSPVDGDPSGLGVFVFPLRFGGTYDDPETNGLYNYFRDLDPVLGRYRQSDLIGLSGGLNTYLYAHANPLRHVDPFGLDTAGCDGVPGIVEGPCTLRCCAKHDECFDKWKCTGASFYSKDGCFPRQCDKCNTDVRDCFMKCTYARRHNADWPMYYCAKQHRYVSIPGDFSSQSAAEAACEYDHSKDRQCCTP